MRNVILDNIRSEVRSFLLDGTKMPVRDVRWTADIARIIQEERINVESELEDSIYKKQYILIGIEISFDEWLAISKSLYKVTPDNVVVSIARGPDCGKEWICDSLGDCHRKVCKLISYKRHDHFVRGHSFAYIPEEKAS